ncbi:MAG: hypothetical protein M5U28_30385 [Sandaracinaceae bacterium]|nr:hypothetical protein [Sandaracinaceae bacterium]
MEEVLVNVHGVREAAVVGVPDEILGEAVHAFVVLDEGADLTEERLRRHCHDRLEPFMVPSRIVVRASLPRTPTGKIDKARLAAERAEERAGRDESEHGPGARSGRGAA